MTRESTDLLRRPDRRPDLPRPRLKPRTRYPTVSIKPLLRGPWEKLAWIFGFRR